MCYQNFLTDSESIGSKNSTIPLSYFFNFYYFIWLDIPPKRTIEKSITQIHIRNLNYTSFVY